MIKIIYRHNNIKRLKYLQKREKSTLSRHILLLKLESDDKFTISAGKKYNYDIMLYPSFNTRQ